MLLHGMFADGTQWRVMADMLAESFRVIVVDLLGHGKSPRPKNAKYTPHEHSIALRKTLEKLDATTDATIVGYSMGGTVALQYAADYHDVAQLYMISTPFYLKPEEMVAAGYANSLTYTKLSVGLYRQVDKLLRPGKLLNKLAGNDNVMKGLHYLIDAYDNQLDPEIMRRNLDRLINNYPFITNLSKVTAPTTFFSGKRDVFVVQGQLRALKRVQPLMEIQSLGIVKNDHMLVQYLPKKMVGILTRYKQRELYKATDIGAGEVLVLLHGIESASSYWSNIIPSLSKSYRVICIDLLGFGRSPKPLNVAYSLQDQVKWLHRTLQENGIKSFHIVGHSLGALVALAYAAQYSKEVKSLSMVAPVFFDDKANAKKFLVKRLHFAHYFSDTNYLASTISNAIGSEKLQPYIPTIRSIENAIKNQGSLGLAKKAKKVPVTVIYGDRDSLVDVDILESISGQLNTVKRVVIAGAGHNFPLTRPDDLLSNLRFDLKDNPRPRKSSLKPKNFFRQLVRLAFPVLLVKGLFYISLAALLLSRFREEALVVAVAMVVILQSIQFVRGSFSLKNEGLSYLGYFSIGIFGAIFGYLLFNHFELSLKLAVLVSSGFILVNGISRLLAGYLWTTRQPLRRRQVLSGWLLFVLGITAFFGSTKSAHAILYMIIAYALVRGATYLLYSFATLGFAYVRGYQ